MPTFGKTPSEIVRLRNAELSFANMLAPSFKHVTEDLSTPAALEFSTFVIIFFRSTVQAKII